jgi:hypothetical protein
MTFDEGLRAGAVTPRERRPDGPSYASRKAPKPSPATMETRRCLLEKYPYGIVFEVIDDVVVAVAGCRVENPGAPVRSHRSRVPTPARRVSVPVPVRSSASRRRRDRGTDVFGSP